jgi:hypothetical protein
LTRQNYGTKWRRGKIPPQVVPARIVGMNTSNWRPPFSFPSPPARSKHNPGFTAQNQTARDENDGFRLLARQKYHAPKALMAVTAPPTFAAKEAAFCTSTTGKIAKTTYSSVIENPEKAASRTPQ